MLTGVSADYYYGNGGSSFDSDWGNVPQFDSQEQIVQEFVAPFLFIVVLLQFSLRKALEFTFDNGSDRPAPWEDDGPSVDREATVMAVAIALMMVASPYWSWIQTVAASLGLIAMIGILSVFLFLIYLFVKP